MQKITVSLCAVLGLFLLPAVGFAAPAKADLQIQIQGPSSSSISTVTAYNVSVNNAGPATAENVQVTVSFPLTNTSPTVTILGTVSGIDSRCSLVANKLVCNLGSLRKNRAVAFSYSYTAPVSTKVLQMTAVASSSTNDSNSGNNTASLVPNLTYPARPFASAVVTNSHCTGQALTSYFECLLYPSSLAQHTATLNADLSITLSEPGYTGSWSQPTSKQLFFEYFDQNGKVAEFNGYAINGLNCFDGLTTFFPLGAYVSPYRVCLQ